MKRIICILIFTSSFLASSCNQTVNISSKMKNLVIFTEYGFGGSSYELIQDNNKLIILEKIYKSGLNEYLSTKYKIDSISQYDIKFHKIIETNNPNYTSESSKYSLHLGTNNSFELIVNNKMYLETSRERK